ncbi:carbohydrate kinase family protein [Sphaerisporangium corydalis]|uniref:Carbohydrate kinase n=1 Tax=Sphaerisporangium corydalis TaxID=1441875 RepID=A0ABV9EI83_9ACTN|nr:carbohydrate kinase [Sphaerisporangium corydalis]
MIASAPCTAATSQEHPYRAGLRHQNLPPRPGRGGDLVVTSGHGDDLVFASRHGDDLVVVSGRGVQGRESVLMDEHIAVIGEAVADAFVIPGEGMLDLQVRPGGGPVNTAVALGRLGTPTRFLGRLSDDTLGRLIRDHLTGSGVDLSACVTATRRATLAITALDAAGRASYDFYTEGTADWFWTDEELTERAPYDACCVHAGSLALVLEPGGPRVERLLETMRARATISIDPNVRTALVPPATYREALPRWARIADILRLSDEDLAHLGLSADEACDTWHELGVRLVVVTRGAEDVLASLDGLRITVPAVQVAAVDTVGAGDTFTAGLLHVLRERGRLGGRLDTLTAADIESAIHFATRAAAETCKVPGANPPWPHQL